MQSAMDILPAVKKSITEALTDSQLDSLWTVIVFHSEDSVVREWNIW